MPEPTESRITRLLGDRYELIELLGKGGFAGVYRVRNLRLQRTEALKVLSETLTEDTDFAKRFEQEARVAAALDHPHIVKIYDYGAIEDFFWFSMQFIGGPSVARQLRMRGHFDDSASARIAMGILDALAYSHARGVIHRDIKPDNILLDHDGRPYLTDFGVAKSQMALVKTHVGTLLGSPAYMSPEQLQGKPLDGRSDVYSLGVTLYRMLCGRLPFTGDDTFRNTMKRLTENPEPLVSRRSDVHPLLADIVMHALERDPAKRFPDALAMREEIESFLTDVTPPRSTRGSLAAVKSSDATPTAFPGAQSSSWADDPTVASGPIVAQVPDQSLTPSWAKSTDGPGPPPASAPLAEPGTPTPPPPPTRPAASRLPSRPASTSLRPADWIALGAAIVVLAALALLVARRPHRREGEVAPAPTRLATRPAPTAAGAALGPMPSPSPTEATTPEPEPSPTEEPTSPPTPRPIAAARPTRRATLSPTRPPTRPPTAAPTHAPTPLPTPEPGKRNPPEILEQAPLFLSQEALATHHNESIGLLVVIGADGKLKSARLISPLCPECDRAALEAVRHFRFRPATDAKGNPVEGSFGFVIRVP